MAQQITPAAQLVPKFQSIRRCNNYVVLQSIPLFHMAQQVIPAAQLVPRYHTIGRCNNYARTVSRVPDTEDTIKFMMDTDEFTYTVDMFRVTLHFPVETPEKPFVAPINIQTIEAFMNRIGYQGVVDKVSAFYTKNLAQPWQTLFKVFNRCLTIRTSGHDLTKFNILQLFHDVINQTNVDYVAFYVDFMNMCLKKEAIHPQRIDEDNHSIKDDIPLEYETVFIGVDVLMNQPQPVVSTQRIHRSTPRAHRTPTVSIKRKQSVGESNSPQKSLKITIRQKKVGEGEKCEQSYDDVDDSDNRRTSQDVQTSGIYDQEYGTDAFRSEVPGLLSQEFNTHAPKIIEELFKNYKSSLQGQANDLTLWDVLKCKFEKSSTSKSSCRDDDFHSHGHDDHQEDAPPEGEKRVKRHKTFKSSKYARGSSSKRSVKDSTTYVSKQ
ncbi:hypothetical protein Tco_0439472 [Tanacetum coccineum]